MQRSLRYLCLLLAWRLPAAAEEPEVQLPETIVSATRTEREEQATPRSVSTVPGAEIVRRGARTTPEALAEETGVLVQETNFGGGSPFIRGLTGNQILVLVDGIRVNNSAFTRYGPNQYLGTVDPFSIARMEVVRGPGSLQYGSDALGGVVAVETWTRGTYEEGLHHEIEGYLRYGSAAREKTVAVRGEGNRGAWGFVAGGSFQDFEDVTGGRDTGLQVPTGYEAGAGDLKISRRLGEAGTLTAAYQYVEQNKVPRTDRITSGANLVFEFEPQRRQLGYVRWEGAPGDMLDALAATLSFHRQEEGRREIRAGAPETTRLLRDRVDTLGLTTQGSRRVGAHRLSAGLDLYDDDVSSGRTDVTEGEDPVTRDGRLPDGAAYTSFGVYVEDEIDLENGWSALLGVRWSWFEHDAVVADPVGPVSGRTDALTWQAGVAYEVAPGVRPYGNFATGFRAPNLDDLTIYDVFGGGVEVPNFDLDPERSLNFELGVKVRRPGFRLTAAGFYSDFEDLIQRAPTDRPPINGEPVFTRENVGSARIFGFEIDVTKRVGDSPWSVRGNLAWVRGDDQTAGTPLTRIPPLLGLFGVRYDDPDRGWYVELLTRFADDQHRLSASDIADPRIPEGGTPGWATLNLRGGCRLDGHVRVEASLQNLFDTSYRIHGSGIDAPGLNFLVTLVFDT